jgi:hypothetical protein
MAAPNAFRVELLHMRREPLPIRAVLGAAWQVDGPAVEHRTVFLPEQPIREMQPPAGSVSSETSRIVMSCLALYSFALPNDLAD